MAAYQLLTVKTAFPKNSIWRDVSLGSFRRNVASLKQASEAVGDKKVHTRDSTDDTRRLDACYTLPFETEKIFVNHLAFIAAIEKSARRVTAVSLEESPDSVTVRLASNGAVHPMVEETLRAILDLLSGCANRRVPISVCQERVYDYVIKINRQRILGRLQSKLWKPPKHLGRKPLEPLHESLRRLIFVSNSLRRSDDVHGSLLRLCTLYESLDNSETGSDNELQKLRLLGRESYGFCTSYGASLEMSKVMYSKHLQEVNKIGRYWGLCEQITGISRKYRSLFTRITMVTLTPYEAIFLPTLPGKANIKCHVHAEIQLLTFYALHSATQLKAPRAFGVSRSACYLCNLFIRQHGQFFVSRTHGKLYDQWTVPDVFNYQHLELQRLNFRRVLQAINNELLHGIVTQQRRVRKRLPGRQLPNESEATLPTGLPRSALPSDAGTLLSNKSSMTITGATASLPHSRLITPPPEQLKPTSPSPPTAQPGDRIQQANALPQTQATEPSTSHQLHSKDLYALGTSSNTSPIISCATRSPAQSPQSSEDDDPAKTTTPIVITTTPPTTTTTTTIPPFAHLSPPQPPPPPPPSLLPTRKPTTTSTQTINSWEHPISHSIQANRPLKTSTNNFNVTIDVEEPVVGSVQITHGRYKREIHKCSNGAKQQTVDVRAMRLNESRDFRCEDGEEDLTLNLLHNGRDGGQVMQVRLRWR